MNQNFRIIFFFFIFLCSGIERCRKCIHTTHMLAERNIGRCFQRTYNRSVVPMFRFGTIQVSLKKKRFIFLFPKQKTYSSFDPPQTSTTGSGSFHNRWRYIRRSFIRTFTERCRLQLHFGWYINSQFRIVYQGSAVRYRRRSHQTFTVPTKVPQSGRNLKGAKSM